MSWLRVTRGTPCPICRKPDWCLISDDGSAAICQRVELSKRVSEAGYLHILDSSKSKKYKRCRRILKIENKKESIDFAAIAKQYQQAMNDKRYNKVLAALGVSIDSLKRLCVGFEGRAFTFPMSDANGNVIGIRRRFPNGFKVCVEGSSNGLFIPQGLSYSGTLLIAEGNSDTAAGLDLGFDAIGRPNNNGGTDLIIRFLKLHSYQTVVIVPDNDVKPNGTNPKLTGGQRLAERLRSYCPDVWGGDSTGGNGLEGLGQCRINKDGTI